MKRRRFFLADVPAAPCTQPLPENIAHYAAHVLRLRDGDEVELFDGKGRVAEGTLVGAAVRVDKITDAAATAPLCVAAPLLKGERQDWMIEKMCELGAHAYAPLLCERAQFQALSENKHERFLRVAQAAARQSGRTHAMEILPPLAFKDLAFADCVVLDSEAKQSLARACIAPPEWLVIGPEGGLTQKEIALACEHGARTARLAAFTLRAETAVIAALSVAATLREE